MRESECIVDIGSASVGVCILEKEHGKKPVISNTVRIPISSGSEEAKAGIQTLVIQTLTKAFESLKGVKAPSAVRVVLAAPWYSGKITTINSRSEKPVRVDEGTIARAVKEYFSRKGSGHQGSLIESVVSQAYVNGYPTTLKNALVGNAMRVNHYASEADHAMQAAALEAAKKAFPNAKISFHSFSFVAFAVLRSLRDEENFLIADVGGEITDIAVAHHDGLRFIGTFPVGTLSVTRAVADKGSIADAKSRLALFAKNELSTEESETFAKKFEQAGAAWNKEYLATLEIAVKEVAIPQTTFVFAERDELLWLQSLFNGTHGAFSSRAVLMTPDVFHKAMTLGENAIYDAFLSAEAVYFSLDRHDLIEVPGI